MWETLNLYGSNWSNVKVIFEDDFLSLKSLNMEDCESLDSAIVEHIGLKSLGKSLHFSFVIEFQWFYDVRDSRPQLFKLVKREGDLRRRLSVFEVVEYKQLQIIRFRRCRAHWT